MFTNFLFCKEVFDLLTRIGGEKGSEYYILKVYYDTENHPDEYVPVPLRIVGNIPVSSFG